ncbi:hypothetical protein Pmani_013964 [Petrolisthes manimaculis]|uniref:Uncharacterized protein n=1 Tax=Petrolisthes manimaculis TaxID=1843537 RepID=A0AAE1U8U9_9EUCA|nr:hypothetical protein Pmani_013964 [Petrolisthes manimaculis]
MGESVPVYTHGGGGDVQTHIQGNHEREKAVSAAVEMVVASARLGVVTLCASVAHIIRDKIRLEQQVVELEKKLEAFESRGINRVSGVTCHSATHGESLPESPSSLRCGSAPPSFLTIPPRKLSGNDSQIVKEVCQNCESGGSQFYCSACQQRQTDNHDSSQNITPLRKSDFTCGFAQRHTHASTRSLNLSRAPSASRFMRRKYSTISLRRIHRTGLSSKGSSSGTLSQSSSSSTGSQEWADDSSRRGSNSSRSCVVTVAEVYSPPSPPPLPTTESAAVKLLAKKLASVMQEENWDSWPSLGCPSNSDPLQGYSAHPDTPSTSSPTTFAQDDLCAPYPLEGCECVVCTRMSSDLASPMYSLTTSEGPLLPRGSMVLVRGDMVGTVIYIGHRRHPFPNKGMQYLSPTSSPTQASSVLWNGGVVMDDVGNSADVASSPLGVTIALWSPDQGELFVPLRDVVCQLDEEVDTERGEGTHSPSLVDCSNACPSSMQFIQVSGDDDDHHNQRGEFQQRDVIENAQHDNPEHATSSAMMFSFQENVPVYPVESHHIDLPMSSDYKEKPKSVSEIAKASKDNKIYGLVPVYNPSVVQRLRQTCGLDQDTEDMCKNNTENYIDQSTYYKVASNKNLLQSSENELLKIKNIESPFCVDLYPDNRKIEQRSSDTEPEVSIYDTSDSAISLTFTRQTQNHDEICCVETSTQPPTSHAETDVESLHFGDTWDSGCCMNRGRCGSLSSEQLSDLECENTKLKSPWAQSLNDAFDSVWNKYPSGPDSCNSNRYTKFDSEYQSRYSSLTSALSHRSSRRPVKDKFSQSTIDMSSEELSLKDFNNKFHQPPCDQKTPPQLCISSCLMDDSEV